MNHKLFIGSTMALSCLLFSYAPGSDAIPADQHSVILAAASMGAGSESTGTEVTSTGTGISGTETGAGSAGMDITPNSTDGTNLGAPGPNNGTGSGTTNNGDCPPGATAGNCSNTNPSTSGTIPYGQ
jgi:hypothetical protein